MAVDPSLAGRVALVTGGSRGLGREMALALLEAGGCVYITANGPSAALDQTLADAAAMGASDRCAWMAADVTDATACECAVADAIGRFGPIDVLVNNAGRGMRLVSETFNTQPTKFWQADTDAWRKIVDVNVNGAFLMAKAVTPHFIQRSFGKIINVSTSDQTMVRRGYAPYGPSKAFLEAASRIWAQDLEGTGVTVNVLLPGGASDTDLLPPDARRGADGNLLPASIMRAPFLFLASDQSNGMTNLRVIARLWQEELALPERLTAAASPPIDKPRIM